MKKKNKKPNQNKKLDGWAQKSVKSTEERIGELEIGKWKLFHGRAIVMTLGPLGGRTIMRP